MKVDFTSLEQTEDSIQMNVNLTYESSVAVSDVEKYVKEIVGRMVGSITKGIRIKKVRMPRKYKKSVKNKAFEIFSSNGSDVEIVVDSKERSISKTLPALIIYVKRMKRERPKAKKPTVLSYTGTITINSEKSV